MPRLYLGAKKTISSFVARDKSISSYTTQFWIQHFRSSRSFFAVSICGFVLYLNILQHELNKRIWLYVLYCLMIIVWGIKKFLDSRLLLVYDVEDDNCTLESKAGYQELCDMLMTWERAWAGDRIQTKLRSALLLWTSRLTQIKTSFTSNRVKLRLRFTWRSPDTHLTTWPSSDLPLALTRPLPYLD